MNSSSIQSGRHSSSGAFNPDPYRLSAWGVLTLFLFVLPAILVALVAFRSPLPVDPWAQAAALVGADRSQVYNGSVVYKEGCAVCHGQDAQGLPRLGKPLRNSAFVQGHTDDELFQLISQGRLPADPENTTGAVMPARANQGLGDAALVSVIVFLRTLQDPTQPTASIDEWIIDQSASASGGGASGMGGVGHDLFVASCSACHGPNGEGMEGLGKPLASSVFLESQSDEDLMNFIKSGRPIWDPLNTTGVDMPPKGGNPAITDEQIEQIIRYLRAVHDQPGAQ